MSFILWCFVASRLHGLWHYIEFLESFVAGRLDESKTLYSVFFFDFYVFFFGFLVLRQFALMERIAKDSV